MEATQKSSKTQMNALLKRACLFFAIVAIYILIIGFNDTHLLNVLPGFTSGGKQTIIREDERKESETGTEDAISKSSNVIELTGEPYLNRWQRRFSNLTNTTTSATTTTGRYFFFKHIRKAGGTSLRSYFRDVFGYHGISCSRDDFSKIRHGKRAPPEILYVEHEFQTMDSECAIHDARWDNSLRVITLRHPIERHMSEFFFSGPGHKFEIDRQKLYTNKRYTRQLAAFLNESVPLWIKQEGGGNSFLSRFGKLEGRVNMYFGRFYTNNFQLRALSGCSSEECLRKRQVGEFKQEMQMLHPLTNSTLYSSPQPLCTQYFNKDHALFDPCAKGRDKVDECELGCDGPCFYPSVAWGPLGQSDIERAIAALGKFDIVLLTETYDDPDQAAFLADVLGVPRDATFSLANHNVTNVVVQKTNKHDKTRFYRDLLSKLSPTSLDMLRSENELEIEFFKKAVEVNRKMTNEWKRETDWQD